MRPLPIHPLLLNTQVFPTLLPFNSLSAAACMTYWRETSWDLRAKDRTLGTARISKELQVPWVQVSGWAFQELSYTRSNSTALILP